MPNFSNISFSILLLATLLIAQCSAPPKQTRVAPLVLELYQSLQARRITVADINLDKFDSEEIEELRYLLQLDIESAKQKNSDRDEYDICAVDRYILDLDQSLELFEVIDRKSEYREYQTLIDVFVDDIYTSRLPPLVFDGNIESATEVSEFVNSAFERDQMLLQVYFNAGTELSDARKIFGGKAMQIALNRLNCDRYREANAGLYQVLELVGWPYAPEYEERLVVRIGTLILHQDLDYSLQELALSLLEEQVKLNPEPFTQIYPYLVDRVAVNGNMPQVYGTQIRRVNGVCEPATAILDFDKVNARRSIYQLSDLETDLASSHGCAEINLEDSK